MSKDQKIVSSDIPVIQHAQMFPIIRNSYEALLPLFVWGTFGIGKSFMLKEFGKKYVAEHNSKEGAVHWEFSDSPKDLNDPSKFVVLVIPLHQYDVSEIKGIPMPNKEHTATQWLPTELLPRSGQGIMFFDELNLAPPLVQANCYQLIMERRLGSYEVPKGWLAIAAGNTSEDRAHNFEMANPLKNRFLHVRLNVPTSESWAKEFAIPNQLDTRVINFLLAFEQYLYKFDPTKDDDLLAIPTPRMWEYASRAIRNTEDNDEDNLRTFIGMCVGGGIANEFCAWMSLSRQYNIAEIFEAGTIEVPKETDAKYALMSALLSYYNKMKDVKAVDKAKKPKKMVVTFVKLALLFPKEYTLMLFQQVKGFDDKFFAKLAADDAPLMNSIVEKYIKFLI